MTNSTSTSPYTFWTSLAILTALVLGNTILLALVAFVTTEPLFGLTGTEVGTLMHLDRELLENERFALLWMQGLTAIGAFIIPSLLFFKIHDESWSKGLKRPAYHIGMGLILLALAAPGIEFLYSLNYHIPLSDTLHAYFMEQEELAAKLTQMLLPTGGISNLFVALIVMAVIPAFGEELLFRRVGIPLIQKSGIGIHAAIFISALLFSAMHMQFFGFLPRFFLGVIFGYAFVLSESVWLPILLHFINNGLIVFISYFSGKMELEASQEIHYWALCFILAVVSLIYWMGMKKKAGYEF